MARIFLSPAVENSRLWSERICLQPTSSKANSSSAIDSFRNSSFARSAESSVEISRISIREPEPFPLGRNDSESQSPEESSLSGIIYPHYLGRSVVAVHRFNISE